MKIVISILAIAFYAGAYAATLRGDQADDINVTEIKEKFYNEDNVVYRGQHEIVKIYLPLFLMGGRIEKMLFVIEASRNQDGSKTDKGLYVTINDSTVKKLLENGRDIDGDALGNVYFAASDGVYIYDRKENRARKTGALNESILFVAAENNSGIIHALSENHVLYTIVANESKANINDRVNGAQEIVMNIQENSLFYYDANNSVYVLNKDGTMYKIKGIPDNPSKLKVIKPPVQMEGMIFLVNDEDAYLAFSNGTSTIIDMTGNKGIPNSIKPTAYSLEAGLLLYYAHDRKVYELNIITMILSAISQKFKDFFQRWFSG